MEYQIKDYAYAENREMTEADIPDGTTYIGKHAFYNCRSLHTLYLPHGGIEIGDGAFKNCRSLSLIVMAHGDTDCTCLKDILYDIYQDVTVSVSYDDGTKAQLFFPHYEYEYIANEPARIFQEVGYGTGYLYQQCFYDAKIDFRRYDDLWSRACVSEEPAVLARILSYRLRFPHCLSQKAENTYLDYWNSHCKDMLTCFMTEQDLDSLRFFLESKKADAGLLSLAKKTAQDLETPQIISYLLDLEQRQIRRQPATDKFDL